MNAKRYEYDPEAGAIVRLCAEGVPLILRKRDPRWKALGGPDGAYTQTDRARLSALDEEAAQKLLKEWGHAERMQKDHELMRARHSVRQYLDRPIPQAIRSQLDAYVCELNADSGLAIQIVYDEPACFRSAKARYGSFAGCSNYIAVVGRRTIDDLETRAGFYGELLVMKAQELGLNTCWVALTHGKSKAVVKEEEREVILISLGYGKTQGAARKSKTVFDVSNCAPDSPDWFKRGVEAALLAPTAINQQRFQLTLAGHKVRLASGRVGPCLKIDAGIVKCHFELGAGRENFEWDSES